MKPLQSCLCVRPIADGLGAAAQSGVAIKKSKPVSTFYFACFLGGKL